MSDNAPPQWHKITSRSLRLGNLKVPRNYTARNHEKRDSSRDSSDVSFPFPETILIAFFTALLYMMTASFEFGYRDAFNVDYNPSIGVAEITDSLYIFLLPLALSLAVSLLIAFIPSFSRRGSLTEPFISTFPDSVSVHMFVDFNVRLETILRVYSHISTNNVLLLRYR
jgi:hypothetical protein